MTNGDDYVNPASHSVHDYPGITKREYMAALQMQGMQSANPSQGLRAETLAKYAVQMADALIEALNKDSE